MITIEDSNNEHFYINPINVIYVKRREKFWKILLSNGEAIMTKNGEGAMVGASPVWRGPGHFRKSKANDLHRLELQQDKDGNEIPCWSLFIMGRQKQDWGFKTAIRGTYTWIHNEKYLKEKYGS